MLSIVCRPYVNANESRRFEIILLHYFVNDILSFSQILVTNFEDFVSQFIKILRVYQNNVQIRVEVKCTSLGKSLSHCLCPVFKFLYATFVYPHSRHGPIQMTEMKIGIVAIPRWDQMGFKVLQEIRKYFRQQTVLVWRNSNSNPVSRHFCDSVQRCKCRHLVAETSVSKSGQNCCIVGE